jgi:cytochrome c-type biogenesis protein CcmH
MRFSGVNDMSPRPALRAARARRLVAWATAGLGLLLWQDGVVRAAGPQDVEDRVREIAAELRCVVCQNLSVADSPSDLAKEMRNLVREQVQQGKSREEVQAYFVSRYGEYVLLSPPKRGFNLLVWGLPFLAIVAGGGVVYLVARRWTERAPTDRPAVDPAYAERVRRELKDREDR